MTPDQLQRCIKLGSAETLPDGSSKLLPCRIDDFAANYPHKVYAVIPNDVEDLSKGYQEVTYGKFANMINAASWWMDSQLAGIEGNKSRSVVTYWGPPDLNYAILMVASMKTRRQFLHSSFWVSFEGLTKLFDRVGCRIFLCQGTPEKGSNFEHLAERRPDIQQVHVPSNDEWLQAPRSRHYPYDYQYSAVADDVACILHTTGTTSYPKPMTFTNRRLALFGIQRFLPDIEPSVQPPHVVGKRHNTHFFICHAGGLTFSLFHPVYFEMEAVIAVPRAGVSPAYARQLLETCHIDCVTYAPSLLQPMVRDGKILALLRQLEIISTGGAPVGVDLLDSIRANGGPPVHHLYGQTETWPTIPMQPLSDSTENLLYISFHPLTGCAFRERSEGSWELVVVRKPELKAFQSVFDVYPDTDEYCSGDLFTPHPEHPDYWKFSGRTDDLVALANGQNLLVTPLEQRIERHALISGAAVGQSGRQWPVVIIEPTPDALSLSKDELDKEVWEAVADANKLLQGRTGSAALLQRDFVLSTGPGEIPRTAKGAVDRRRTMEAFGREIDALFGYSI